MTTSTTSTTSTAAAPVAPVAHRRAAFHPLRVEAVDRLTDDAVAVRFEVPPELAEDYRFVAGQHLTLRTEVGGVEVRRNYSICSPATSGRLRVAIKRLGGGLFSEWANTGLQPGDTVDVMTPTGRFCVDMDPTRPRHYAAIAAGSGITPVLSILSTVLEVEPQSSFTLVYGNRTTASVMFLEELADLKNEHPDRLQVVHVLSRETQDVPLLCGRIDAAKLDRLLDTLLPPSTVDDWFLCGPLELVEQARATLAARGVDPTHVHRELFHVEGEPVRQRPADDTVTSDSTVTVVLDGRTTTFELGSYAQSILDATLAVRADAPYACKGGVCGTCRARLLEGTVDMDRDYALEQSEVAAGFVLACQSHPTSDKVVLDFDQ